MNLGDTPAIFLLAVTCKESLMFQKHLRVDGSRSVREILPVILKEDYKFVCFVFLKTVIFLLHCIR